MAGVPQGRTTGQEVTWREIVGCLSLPSSSQISQAAPALVLRCRGGHSGAGCHGEKSTRMLLRPGWERNFPSQDSVPEDPKVGPTAEKGL